ncbi:MAG: alanine racemase [Candidatus Paceibacterota bacterium]
MHSKLRTWIDIDTKALTHNYSFFRKYISKEVALLAVVKSNAYGHGLVDFALHMEKCGVDMIGVDSVVEGISLRKKGIQTPILTLGYVLPEVISDAQEHNITVTVSTFEGLSEVAKSDTSTPLTVHIKVDTGMHRQGFLKHEKARVIEQLKKLPEHVRVTGLYTHFASAKNPVVRGLTNTQIVEFNEWRALFKEEGFKVIAHASATAGALLYPEAHYDMVRIGIGMYGHSPSGEVSAYLGEKLDLRPALTWKTIISEVKKLPEGGRVGYDQLGYIDKGGVLAVCPIGYWHGYPRALSGLGRVIVNGVVARVIGRVSMDMIALDVTNASAKVGDEVCILSPEYPEIGAQNVAGLADTIHYELITQINPLIKRYYV